MNLSVADRDIAIITDDPGWHGKQLVDTFAQLGHQSHFVRLQDCHFNLDQSGSLLDIPGFDDLPHGVFVRGVSGGSLEQVVYYLDILHAFESLGVTVFNNTRSVERSVDKGMTSFLLKKHNIKTPNTFFSSDLHYIRNKLREGLSQGNKFVLKPIFGSQGKGLQLITSQSDLVDYAEFHGVMYAQEFVETGFSVGVDYRVFVIGDQVIASMRREGVDWISNVAQGAKTATINLAADVEQLAIDAMQVLDMDYAGVDLIQDSHGEFWVTEVNSVPAWHGLQQTTSLPIAQLIAKEFLSKC